MNIRYKENQFELFGAEAKSDLSQHSSPRVFAAQLILSGENLVILTICAILVIIFAFSLGIERGKRVALEASGSVITKAMHHEKNTESNVEKVKEPVGIQQMDSTTIAKNVTQAIVEDVVKVAQTGFTIQVASYKTEKPALREAENLKKKGYNDVYILNKGQYVILCVGNFPSRDGAQQLTKKLKSNYQDLVLRRL